MAETKMVTLHDIRAAQTLLHGIAVRTPLFEWTGAADQRKLYLKLENLQPIGAFKLRGAYNKVASLRTTSAAAGSFPIRVAITRRAWPTRRGRWA